MERSMWKALEVGKSLESSRIRPHVPFISNSASLIIEIIHVHCSKFERLREPQICVPVFLLEKYDCSSYTTRAVDHLR